MLWACPVLFADEPARAARLQGLATQQRRLGAQQAELQGRLDEKAAVQTLTATGFAEQCRCGPRGGYSVLAYACRPTGRSVDHPATSALSECCGVGGTDQSVHARPCTW